MKIRSFSAPDEVDTLILSRKKALGMTLSEYARKCFREEAERAMAQEIMATPGGRFSIGSMARMGAL